MYKICDSYLGEKTLKDWWTLIGYIIEKSLYNYIAHTKNEFHTFIVYKYNWKFRDEFPTGEYYDRNIIIYDEDNTIVNLSEIKEGIKNYIPKKKKHNKKFRGWTLMSQFNYKYRCDSVPFIGKSVRKSYRNTPRNKNYILGVMSYMDDNRIRSMYLHISDWCDEGRYQHRKPKSWKNYRSNQYKE